MANRRMPPRDGVRAPGLLNHDRIGRVVVSNGGVTNHLKDSSSVSRRILGTTTRRVVRAPKKRDVQSDVWDGHDEGCHSEGAEATAALRHWVPSRVLEAFVPACTKATSTSRKFEWWPRAIQSTWWHTSDIDACRRGQMQTDGVQRTVYELHASCTLVVFGVLHSIQPVCS